MAGKKLIGPFAQIVTMRVKPAGLISNGGIIIDGTVISEVGSFNQLRTKAIEENIPVDTITSPLVLMPGLIDAHTHICYAGSRARDYMMRSEGRSYLEIAKDGGGIMSTVHETRKATLAELVDGLMKKGIQLLKEGVTTCEIKSGYGLTVRDELKMLQAIHLANEQLAIDLIPTALPAHICPPEFNDPKKYLRHICEELLPEVKRQSLSNRADIFIEESAFSVEDGHYYLTQCQEMGFDLTIHADQFSTGGSQLAVDYKASSADHLEASGQKEIALLADSQTIGTVLPGASLGLGIPFAPARKLIDKGVKVCIASDWNPGSAPMGDLLVQASLLGMYEKLNGMEILSGITVNAANALKLTDRGAFDVGKKADMIAFPCKDHSEIFYHQGKLKPSKIWKNGQTIK